MISNGKASKAYELDNDQTVEATEYLQKHKIPQLIQHLTSSLLYEQPDDPKGFLVKELEKIYQEKKSTGESSDESPANLNPVYFTDVNLQALFQIYDRNNKGFISLDDYFSAMSNLNVSEFNKQPKGHAGNRVDQNTFVQECKLALANVPLNSSQ